MEDQTPTPVQTPPTEDRSAFNCEACGGEGLKDQNTLCPICNGTGKKPHGGSQYPVGTNVITPNGTFVVDEKGDLVQQ